MTAAAGGSGNTKPNVKVFTDCKAALFRIEQFRHVGPRDSEFQKLHELGELIIASQHLSHRLRVGVELRWVPSG